MVMMTGVLWAMLWHMWSISSRVASFTRLPSHSHPCHNSEGEHQWIISVLKTKELRLPEFDNFQLSCCSEQFQFHSKSSDRFCEKNVRILHFIIL
jgi:hypothetical protein